MVLPSTVTLTVGGAEVSVIAGTSPAPTVGGVERYALPVIGTVTSADPPQ